MRMKLISCTHTLFSFTEAKGKERERERERERNHAQNSCYYAHEVQLYS